MIQKGFWLVPERTPCAPVRRRATARLTDWIKPKVKSIKGGLVGAKEMEKKGDLRDWLTRSAALRCGERSRTECS